MRAKPYWVLALAVLGISFAGPLVRLSNAGALTIAVWRLGFSLVVVTAFLLGTREWRDWGRLTLQELLLAVAAGGSLGVPLLGCYASVPLHPTPPSGFP